MDKNFITRFLKGSAFTSLGTLATVAFHFLSISFMARLVTKEELGLYFLILAIVNGFKIFGSLGLDLTLVKFLVSEEKDVQENTFTAIIWVRIVVMAVFTVVVFLLGSALLSTFDENIVNYQWFLPVIFTLMSFRELFFYILQGLRKFSSYATVQIISAVFKFSLIAYASFSGSQLDLAILLYIEIAMLVGSSVILLWLLPLRDLSTPNMRFTMPTLKHMLKFGFPLYINSVFTYISDRAAVFIVGIFLNPIAIAAYEVAAKIPQGFGRLFNSFSTVYYPSLSSLFADNDIPNAQKFMNKSLIILAVVTFSFVLGGLLFSEEIIVLVFSDKYLDVQPTFVLLQLSACSHLLASLMGFSLVSAGFPESSTKVNVMAMTMELVLNILLIPILGYIGAAVAYVLMTLTSQALGYFYLRKAGVLIDLQVYIRPFIILAVVAGIYLGIDSQDLFLRIGLFALYIGLSLVFIPDARQAISYVLALVERKRLKKRMAS